MKIRMGFVSNSSSSSFVLICDKDVFDKVWEDLHPYVKEMMSGLKQYKERALLGRNCIMDMGVYSSEDGNREFIEDYDGDLLDYNGEEIKVGTEEYKEYKEDIWYECFTKIQAMCLIAEKANEIEKDCAIFCEDY